MIDKLTSGEPLKNISETTVHFVVLLENIAIRMKPHDIRGLD